jgi:GAF domain-containing protein
MITTSRPLMVGDVREDLRFPSLVEARYLSWMGIPLLTKGVVIGVIALEKMEPFFYTSEHIQAMVTFAGQAAVALENANLYEESVQRASELDERSQRLALLNRVSTAISHSLDQTTIFSVLTNELPQALPCSLVSVVTLDGSGNGAVRAQTPTLSPQLPLQIPENEVFRRLRESLGIFTTEDCKNEPDLQPLLPYLEETNTCSLLIVPMASGSDLVGLAWFIRLSRIVSRQRRSAEKDDLQPGRGSSECTLFRETERLLRRHEAQH